ncbi:MAG: anthranilate synthase component I family protein [Thermoplasmatota archaeon]
MIHIPVADAPAPHVAHARLAARSPTSFILESREGPERLARYSFVGWDPAAVVRCDADGLHVSGALPAPSRDQDPLTYLRRVLAFYHTDDHEAPFVGGLVGSVGYDFVRTVEPTLDDGTPEAWPRFVFGLYLDGLVYDHQEGTCTYISRGEDRSAALQAAIGQDAPPAPLAVGPLTASTDQEAFEKQVRGAQGLIRQGEAFQIVLSRRYEASFGGDLGRCYDWLRENAAVPYLFHLRFAAHGDDEEPLTLLGASPETLVRVRRGTARTFPIAGTRPVTGDEAKDDAAAEDLLADPKETAEHAMLVDLARNDLGRVSAPGTVKVASLMEIQRFRHVQHIVSDVEGRLAPGQDALDALAAVFPAGTVSGAPKVRAMEHIAALERHAELPRGPYAGAAAYASFNGDFDSCIAIRSLSAVGSRLAIQAGAGIVHHSRPDAEFHETRHKAATLLEAVQRFGATLPEAEQPPAQEATA